VADEHPQPRRHPGGTCEFDLPGYYAWQHLPPERARRPGALGRHAGAAGRVDPPAAEAAARLGRAAEGDRHGGQLQQTLPQGRTFQLLRLRIDPALGLVPEISGNRLIVSVRLMRQESDRCSQQRQRPFELTLCA
jgi:cell division protein ZapD